MIQEKVRSITHLRRLRTKAGGEELFPINLLALGDEQSPFRDGERLDGLDGPSQRDLGPHLESASIVAISPHQLETGKQLLQRLQQGTASLLIGALGSRYLDRQQVALRINERVAFPAPDFFPPIIALLRTTNRTGFDRLTVDDPRTRFSLSPLFFAHLHPQGTQNLIPNSFALPLTKVGVDGAPSGQLMRQQAPGTPTSHHVQDGVAAFPALIHVIVSFCTKRL